jgi:hypothetical protein
LSGKATPCIGGFIEQSRIPVVTVSVTQGGKVVATSKADNDGHYSFSLPPGTYTVGVTDPVTSSQVVVSDGQTTSWNRIAACS